MWNTVAVEMRMWLLEVEMLGIGRMGVSGRIGHRRELRKQRVLVRQVLVAVLVTRLVSVRETGQVMVVQRMGVEPRPWLGETRADPPPPEPTESHTGEGRRIGRGCPRARRSTAASFCGGKRPRL